MVLRLDVMSDDLAKELREARRRHGHSIHEAGAAIGMTGSAWARAEKSGRVAAKRFPALADYTGKPVEHLSALATGEIPPGLRDADVQQILDAVLSELEKVNAEHQALREQVRDLQAQIVRQQGVLIEMMRPAPPRRRS